MWKKIEGRKPDKEEIERKAMSLVNEKLVPELRKELDRLDDLFIRISSIKDKGM